MEQRLITKQTPREPLMEGEVLVYQLLLERRETLDARLVETWRNLGVSRRAGLFTRSLLQHKSSGHHVHSVTAILEYLSDLLMVTSCACDATYIDLEEACFPESE